MSNSLRASNLLRLVGLAVLAAIVYLPSLPSRDLWYPDEIRYTEVPRQMREAGELLVPHLNGKPYSDKPPLFFWLTDALTRAGAGEFASRIVTAMSVFGTMVLVWATGSLWGRSGAGMRAALILPLFECTSWIGRHGVIDPLLMFTVMLAVYGHSRMAAGRKAGGFLFALGMGAGILAKGPVGLLFPMLAALAFGLATPRERRVEIRRVIAGAAAAVVIAAAWVVPACLAGGESYAHDLVWRQNVGRTIDSFAHDQPWFYYLRTLPVALLPWLVVVPVALVAVWRRGTREGRGLVAWILIALFVFSVFSGKRTRYLLPLMPAFALAIGLWLDGGFAPSRTAMQRSGRRLPWIGFACLVLFVGVALAVGPTVWIELDVRGGEASRRLGALQQATPAWIFACVGAMVVAGGIATIVAARRGSPRSTFAAAFASALAMSIAFDAALVPGLNRIESARGPGAAFAARIEAERDSSIQAALYRKDFAGAFNYHANVRHLPILKNEGELAEFMGRRGHAVVVMLSRHLHRMDRSTWRDVDVESIGFLGSREAVLVTDRTDEPWSHGDAGHDQKRYSSETTTFVPGSLRPDPWTR